MNQISQLSQLSMLNQLLTIQSNQVSISSKASKQKEAITDKLCAGCKETKHTSEFYWIKTRQYWSAYCKDCQKARMVIYNQKRGILRAAKRKGE